ncbi:heme lyase CcmF/NrfE family subunit [Aurantivibrio infirmus]
MVPELGHFSLIIALCLSVGVVVLPMLGSYTNNQTLMLSGRSMSAGVFVFTGVALATLIWSFVQDDFSVAYVANHSNTLLPLHYKLTATWGGHEGSLMLWLFYLSCWMFAVSIFARSLPLIIHARVLSIVALLAVGIQLLTLLTSNPFDRILPGSPLEGSDLNPLLQDIGFIMHPPLLYLGFSGFSVAFAFAITALLSGKMDSAWARWCRPWTNVSWAFLTVGIGMGSWWAYYELGWGFWWGWDPTENASLFPWLSGTALLHSLAVTEKRGLFKTWTILLAICTFSLVLLATFITRSGVVSSIHAFGYDPERGNFLLMYIGFVIGGSLLLYAIRAPNVASLSAFKVSARETFMLANNILFSLLLAVVLIGTLYPIIATAFDWGKPSIGAPYFNRFWTLLTVPLCLLMAVASLTQWRQTRAEVFKKYLFHPVVISLVIAVVFPLFYGDKYSFGGALTIFVAAWIVSVSIYSVKKQIRNAPTVWQGLRSLKTSYYSMIIAHIGVAIVFMSAGLTSIYDVERRIILKPNSSQELFGHRYQFNGVEEVRGPNYIAMKATIFVYEDEKLIATLHPEKRRYLATGTPTTEAALEANLFRDLYVALNEAIEPFDEGAWSLTVYVKPFMQLMWLGFLITALGGFMSLVDKRYRIKKIRQEKILSTAQQGKADSLVGDLAKISNTRSTVSPQSKA